MSPPKGMNALVESVNYLQKAGGGLLQGKETNEAMMIRKYVVFIDCNIWLVVLLASLFSISFAEDPWNFIVLADW